MPTDLTASRECSDTAPRGRRAGAADGGSRRGACPATEAGDVDPAPAAACAADLDCTARAACRRPSLVRNRIPRSGSTAITSPARRVRLPHGLTMQHRPVYDDLGDERRIRHDRSNSDQRCQPGELFAWCAVRPFRVEDLRVQQCRCQKQGRGGSKATHPPARAPHLARFGHQFSLVQTSSGRHGTGRFHARYGGQPSDQAADRRTPELGRSDGRAVRSGAGWRLEWFRSWGRPSLRVWRRAQLGRSGP